MLALSLLLPIYLASAEYLINGILNNITNPDVNKHVFGINAPYYGDTSVNYTLCRYGGEKVSRFNWKIGALNSACNWCYITNGSNTWQQIFDPCIDAGQDLLVQISAIGWVGKSRNRSCSYSISKYGPQGSCGGDCGDGVFMNGSEITGNDPNDANIEFDVEDVTEYAQAVISRYGTNRAMYFEIGNEPTLWQDCHKDVHPSPVTYQEIVDKLFTYGPALKSECNDKCKILGYSPWGWCGYFTSGYDSYYGSCTSGPDRHSHNNMSLIAWYLQQAAEYEKQYGQRILDLLDVHYYPQAQGVDFSCDEDAISLKNRLDAPRSLYDWSYTDPSWINEPIALIPRLKAWVDEYYPETGISVSEYNFGGDTCQSALIATAEVLSIYATYGVSVATRWGTPADGSLITNAWNLYTNFDGNRSNIYDDGLYAVYTNSSDLEMVTGYTFISKKDNNKMVYVYLFNKDDKESNIMYKFIGDNNNINTNGVISLYGIDDDGMGIKYIGIVDNKTDSTSFSVTMPKYSVRLAILQQ